jgi:hypothetical protein
VGLEEATDLSTVAAENQDLWEVFSKVRATSLPPHRPYDCGIDLLRALLHPGWRLYSLSGPETKEMEMYIEDSLAAGCIHPSATPTGAGFFLERKDKTLHPCIDYRGLNDITVKNPLLPQLSSRSQRATIFSKYHLVRIWEGDEWKWNGSNSLQHG